MKFPSETYDEVVLSRSLTQGALQGVEEVWRKRRNNKTRCTVWGVGCSQRCSSCSSFCGGGMERRRQGGRRGAPGPARARLPAVPCVFSECSSFSYQVQALSARRWGVAWRSVARRGVAWRGVPRPEVTVSRTPRDSIVGH